jgi:hypothetical protein
LLFFFVSLYNNSRRHWSHVQCQIHQGMHEYYFFFISIFHLFETVLVEWEKCNILDSNGDVLTCLLVLIGKSTFGYLSNMKEKQFKKIVRGLPTKLIIICDHPTKRGGRPNLKLMRKFTKLLKKKVIIQNEIIWFILNFQNQLQIIRNHKFWWRNEKKGKHKLDKMFFSILDFEFNEKFDTKKKIWIFSKRMKHCLHVSKLCWKGELRTLLQRELQ